MKRLNWPLPIPAQHHRSYLWPALIALLAMSLTWAGGLWLWPAPQPKLLLAAGSSQMQTLMRELGQAFNQADNRYSVQVEAGGSAASVDAVRRGAIDLAMVSHPVPGLFSSVEARQHLLARNSIVFIAHVKAPVQALSQAQMRDILLGRTRDWRELGGPAAPIELLSRRKPSAIAEFLEEVALDHQPITHQATLVDSAEEMLSIVEHNPHAIGYVSLPDMPAIASVSRLAINGAAATRATILSGRYPYIQDWSLVSYGSQTPQERAFLQFIRSTTAQEIVERHNLISVY